jgi:hypothetical protein
MPILDDEEKEEIDNPPLERKTVTPPYAKERWGGIPSVFGLGRIKKTI